MIAKLRASFASLADRSARFAQSPYALFVLAAIAIAGTWSFTIAVGPFLVAFCLARPERWWAYALTVTLATAIAAVSVAWALTHGAAPWIAQQLPQLMASPEWLRLKAWIDAAGLPAMLAWLALPLPQAPFMVLIGLTGIAPWKVFVAFLFGKGLKHLATARAAAASVQLSAWALQRRRS